MLNPEMHIPENVFDTPIAASSREGLGRGLVEAGKEDPSLVVLSADVAESTYVHPFVEAYPERFVQVGVAEQNLVTVASGMAASGRVAFASAYAAFSPGRNWEQIKTTIALNNVPVVVSSTHAGLLTGPDGATHQMLEDIALMRVIPNMTVISPADAEEGRKATRAAAKLGKPVYLRFAREKTPVMTSAETPFEIGKANVMWKSDQPDAVIFATGPVLHNALRAAGELESDGVAVTVVNIHTVKPIDREAVVREAREAGAVVTLEEHQIAGGLGSAVAEVLAAEAPTPIEFVGVHDRFGQSGKAMELWEEYGLGVSHVKDAVKKSIARKA